jgi:hypothetical protein
LQTKGQKLQTVLLVPGVGQDETCELQYELSQLHNIAERHAKVHAVQIVPVNLQHDEGAE